MPRMQKYRQFKRRKYVGHMTLVDRHDQHKKPHRASPFPEYARALMYEYQAALFKGIVLTIYEKTPIS